MRLSSPREAPPRDKIGYAFAGSENNIAIWVATGIADAGVFSDMDWEELGRTPVKLKKDLRIFFTTEPIIRSVVVVRGDMPAQLKDRIKNVPSLCTRTEGRKVLKKYYKVKRYDEISGGAARSLERLRRLFDGIRQDLN